MKAFVSVRLCHVAFSSKKTFSWPENIEGLHVLVFSLLQADTDLILRIGIVPLGGWFAYLISILTSSHHLFTCTWHSILIIKNNSPQAYAHSKAIF
jgi:hypothetical protein